eukprot:gnl/Spiro4/18621_TR9987_c0_g1_i1.p1 gnl/Spiro4/18621_TR9987_c0_g1~~gnl/Spiro4/18621_TR9987_c0_g1_i1.p1  ORF type:complete len:304 (+),score=82.72 gnl/Spiro4/18621_TR9987_c0_g1_i1:88-999(+)
MHTDGRYQRDSFLGQGAYGVVSKCFDRAENRFVAVKKIRLGKAHDGVSFTTLREIKFLQELKHPNIVELYDVFSSRSNINLVFEYCPLDLEKIITNKEVLLTPAHIKAYVRMLLEGVHFLHSHWVLHRDLKPSNILVGVDGSLKLADFGLARLYGERATRPLSPNVVTRWYRAPELLFGARAYGIGVDMWAVGCIFAELMLRVPYMAGESDLDQLGKIFSALGTPSEAQWPGMTQLPDYVRFEPAHAAPLRTLFTAVSDNALDLLSSLLRFDPAKRISTAEALSHPYFSELPAPVPCPLPSVK